MSDIMDRVRYFSKPHLSAVQWAIQHIKINVCYLIVWGGRLPSSRVLLLIYHAAVSVYTTPVSDPADNKCATGRISGEGEADQQEGQGWSFTFWNFTDHYGFKFSEGFKIPKPHFRYIYAQYQESHDIFQCASWSVKPENWKMWSFWI